MLHGGKSSPRNKQILPMFNLIGVGKQEGRECAICTIVILPIREKTTPSIETEEKGVNWKEDEESLCHSLRESRCIYYVSFIKDQSIGETSEDSHCSLEKRWLCPQGRHCT